MNYYLSPTMPPVCRCNNAPADIPTQSHNVSYGLGLIDPGKPVPSGSYFEYGIELTSWFVDMSTWAEDNEQFLRYIEQKLAVFGIGDVYASILSGYLNPFLVIQGKNYYDYHTARELQDAITAQVRAAYKNANMGTIRFEVDTYDLNTGQKQTYRYDAPQGGTATNAPPPSPPKDFLNEWALKLGMTKDELILLGLGGLALTVVVVKKL
ncbi:MAG TPA: hypothetical protein PLD20_17940 [Blastocatellia bacterium]|nr:hypothetical protein [Blastocatellia bacterium]HMX26662.1 hypothetical protein [Blastocatellia bacterium]HMY75435.1 hypothetical protein [Blastocatellia bacterium]HMZ19822.1 hypothetical protein [Blastocatellia bacterium]